MARPRKNTPSYLKHKVSGKARAVWTDAAGLPRQQLLPGAYNSRESRKAFAKLQLEIESSPLRSPDPGHVGITVNEVLLAYIGYADQHYRGPDGNPTGETERIKAVCRHVRELYGCTPATDFGPLALKAVRQGLVTAGWCRRSINQQIERVRRAFKWAAGEELIPFEAYHRLTAVSGLQRGRTEARETEPVKPVDDAIVDATVKCLNRHVRGMVSIQRLTGCRPGEACRLRRCDIDMGGTVWLYRLPQHKGTWRGKVRTIAIGPKAQELLRNYFTPALEDYLFSPRRAVEEVRAERAASRKTPRYPSHMKRNAAKRKAEPKRTPSERYNRVSYVNAVHRACDKAFPSPIGLTEEQVKTWRKDHRWHPHQLRHSFATKVRKEHGLEAAQVLLGHSKADVTQIYAEKNYELAAIVASKIG